MITLGTQVSATATARRLPTRERILQVARRLFAERGYRGTSVGDIEAAAGLAPRAGGLYKHFESKEALLRAVMAQHADAVDEFDARLLTLDLGDLHAEVTLVARWGLAELRQEHELTRIVMKEGERFPELRTAFRDLIVGRGHRLGRAWIEARAERFGVRVEDPQALATVLVDALVGYTLEEVLVGPSPAGVDDERFLAAWIDAATTLIRTAIDDRSDSDA
jgi:AcrR family transcriptional regulator